MAFHGNEIQQNSLLRPTRYNNIMSYRPNNDTTIILSCLLVQIQPLQSPLVTFPPAYSVFSWLFHNSSLVFAHPIGFGYNLCQIFPWFSQWHHPHFNSHVSYWEMHFLTVLEKLVSFTDLSPLSFAFLCFNFFVTVISFWKISFIHYLHLCW